MPDNPKYNKQTSDKSLLKGGEIVSAANPKIGPGEAIQAKPLEVIVYDNFEKALRAFRALVQKERILSSFKEKQSFEKPSVKRRRKRAEMKRKRFELENKKHETPEQRKQRKIRKLESQANARPQ